MSLAGPPVVGTRGRCADTHCQYAECVPWLQSVVPLSCLKPASSEDRTELRTSGILAGCERVLAPSSSPCPTRRRPMSSRPRSKGDGRSCPPRTGSSSEPRPSTRAASPSCSTSARMPPSGRRSSASMPPSRMPGCAPPGATTRSTWAIRGGPSPRGSERCCASQSLSGVIRAGERQPVGVVARSVSTALTSTVVRCDRPVSSKKALDGAIHIHLVGA